jgi:S-DNA-T family DNA segregation ATPase FtsK/SpoIIIE
VSTDVTLPDQEILDAETVVITPPRQGGPVDPPDTVSKTWATITSTDNNGRRPILPAWMLSKQQRGTTLRAIGGNVGYTALYHATRSPKYIAKVAWYAPKGYWRAGRALFFFLTGGEQNWKLRNHAADANDALTWQSLNRVRAKESKTHIWLLIPAFVVLAVALAVAYHRGVVPGVAWYALPVALTLLAAYYGQPADKPILDRVQPGTPFRKLTAEIARASLLATGYGKEPADFQFPKEIAREGDGYLAIIDLPAGVTAAMMMERRVQVAGSPALRMPLDQVWLKPGAHAGQLHMWVGDKPVSHMKQPAWPLLKSGRADIFKPLPFATDERNHPLSGLIMFVSVLIGAIPRMGKTFVLRLLMLAAALDPRVEIWAADLKGTGDLRMFERISRRYFVGDDDDEILALLTALRDLVAEMRRRAKVLRSLPPEVCPESKVTPELAADKSLGLHPIVVGIDECQVMFTHPEHGKEFDALCTDLAKRGPALGIILMLATQRPDAKSTPTGISGNVGARICLKVMGQQENDMILGTSMYKNGYRATQFTMADKGMGISVGFFDEPTIVRIHYVDAPTAERVIDRALQLRGGRVVGKFDKQKVKARDMLADARACIRPGESGMPWGVLAERLAELDPEFYAGITADMVRESLARYDIQTQDVKVNGRNLKGVRRTALDAAEEHRQIAGR